MINLRTKFSAAITFLPEAALSTCLKISSSPLYLKTHYSTYKPFTDPQPVNERLSYSERKEKWSGILMAFQKKINSPPDISKLNPKYLTVHGLRNWVNRKQREKMCYEQRYILERHKSLGNDLASAHFLVFRGGAVRFAGQNNWIKDDKYKNVDYDDSLPNTFEPSLYVEALDFCKFPIIYEGLENFRGLLKLKWVSFQGCPHFDDWSLDRFTGEYHDRLEYLDISDTKVTYRGLGALYKCSKLKTLKVNGIADSKLFQLTCLLLEDVKMNLEIEGVKYMNIDQSE